MYPTDTVPSRVSALGGYRLSGPTRLEWHSPRREAVERTLRRGPPASREALFSIQMRNHLARLTIRFALCHAACKQKRSY
jgi:hypothetical protein